MQHQLAPPPLTKTPTKEEEEQQEDEDQDVCLCLQLFASFCCSDNSAQEKGPRGWWGAEGGREGVISLAVTPDAPFLTFFLWPAAVELSKGDLAMLALAAPRDTRWKAFYVL